MTQYPEAYLARELEICYVNIALVTDHDVGAEGVTAVTKDDVIRVFNQNNNRVKDLIFAMIPSLPTTRDCICAHALEGAAF
jgi:5'-methylthioadenosine phosphorylase